MRWPLLDEQMRLAVQLRGLALSAKALGRTGWTDVVAEAQTSGRLVSCR